MYLHLEGSEDEPGFIHKQTDCSVKWCPTSAVIMVSLAVLTPGTLTCTRHASRAATRLSPAVFLAALQYCAACLIADPRNSLRCSVPCSAQEHQCIHGRNIRTMSLSDMRIPESSIAIPEPCTIRVQYVVSCTQMESFACDQTRIAGQECHS